MGLEELEKLIEDRVMKGEINTGIYDTGIAYMVVSIIDDRIKIEWHDHVYDLVDYIEQVE